MVKIINPLGDVKIGKQGEVVYQRKYGEQIRRLVSPKRAMPSQRQIAHRQLYRAALTWRSQLSLANRRYLEGYCMANGIVDSYHIPLPWSRFALKLYLQKVAFVIIEKPIPGIPLSSQIYEYYNINDDNYNFLGLSIWRGQTFTPSLSHKITSVKLKLFRVDDPGIITVSIRGTDGNGHPLLPDLCVGTIDGASLTEDTAGLWYEIFLGAGADLSAGTKYAIVARCGPSTTLGWRRDWSAPTYPGGCWEYSGASGGDGTWMGSTLNDFMFEEWSTTTPIPGVPGLLHVRHPALLTVVHKRGELIVRGYDALSSLNDEYLTKQVGIDVAKGDVIEVTALPDNSYRYEV